MWHRFSESGQRAIFAASRLAEELQSPEVLPEHLLAAILQPESGEVAQLVRQFGVDPHLLRIEVGDATTTDATYRKTQVKLSPKAKSVIEATSSEAKDQKSSSIRPEHLLLGLLKEPSGAQDILLSQGISLEEMRSKVRVTCPPKEPLISPFFLGLLLFVPISALQAFVLKSPPLWVFLTSLLALIPLAELVRKGTEQMAKISGPAVGGLLNVSFGNVPELILGFFVLKAGQVAVVKAQITGAIIGNSLLGLGLCIVVGSWGKEKVTFRKDRAALMGSMLMLVVIALLLPALFNISEQRLLPNANRIDLDQRLSVGVAIVLMLVYVGNLIYTFVTHRDIFAGTGDREPPDCTLKVALALMVLATVGTAFESELISDRLAEAASRMGVSPVFIGIVLLAIIGNVSEYFSAVYFAAKGKMGMAISITAGSSIQIALMVAPLLVLISGFAGHSLNLVFEDPLELIAIAGSAFAVNAITQDGETTWFEGVLLLAVYALFGLGFFYSTR